MGKEFPRSALQKVPLRGFWLAHNVLSHSRVLKGGEDVAPGEKKGLRAGSELPSHWDGTCERGECILGLTPEGDRVLVLLSSLGTLDRVICSWQRLLLPTASFLSHQPVAASWGGKCHLQHLWNKMDFAGRCLTLLLGAGCWP